SGEDIVVRGRASAKLAVPCVRCLEPVVTPISAELALLLKPNPSLRAPKVEKARLAEAKGKKGKVAKESQAGGSKGRAPSASEYELSREEADADAFDGETVILDSFVREALLLETPNFPLCSEACPGIAAASKTGLVEAESVDPRLAPLGALREKLASGRTPK